MDVFNIFYIYIFFVLYNVLFNFILWTECLQSSFTLQFIVTAAVKKTL